MMKEENMLKMAIISGASKALFYKKRKPSASDEEIIQHINGESDAMVEKIGSGS